MLNQRIADLTVGQGIEIYSYFVGTGFMIAGAVILCVAFYRWIKP